MCVSVLSQVNIGDWGWRTSQLIGWDFCERVNLKDLQPMNTDPDDVTVVRSIEWGAGRGSGRPLLPLPLAKQAQGWGGPRGPLLVPPSPRSRQPLGPALPPGTWFGSAELGSWPRATNL